MTHEQASELLTQYLLGDLDQAAMAEVKSHLETCEACRAAVREIEPTLGLLRDALAAPSNAPEHLDVNRHCKIITRATSRKGRVVRWFGESWVSKRQPRLVEVAAVLIIMFILSGLLLPALSSSRKMSTRVADRNSLTAIGTAIRAYSMEHNEQMPQDLNVLRGRYIEGDNVFKSRSSGETVQYLPGAQSADSSSPIAALHGKNGGDVLYRDGSVRWMDDKEFNKEIAPKLAESRSDEARALGWSAGFALSQPTSHIFAGGSGGDESRSAPSEPMLLQPSMRPAAPAPMPADKLNAKIAFDGSAKKDALKNYPVVSKLEPGKDQSFTYSLSRDESSGAKGLAPSTPPSMPQPSIGGRQSSAAAETTSANVQNEVASAKVVGYEKQKKGQPSGPGDLDTPLSTVQAQPAGQLRVIRMGSDEPQYDFEDDTSAAPAQEKPAEPLRVITVGGLVDAKELSKSKAREQETPDTRAQRERRVVKKEDMGNTAEYIAPEPRDVKALEGGASAPPSPQAIKVIRMGEVSAVGSSGKPSDAKEKKDNARAQALAKLENIKIPEIDLKNASIQDAIKILNEAGVKFDTSSASGGKKAPDIQLNLGTPAPAAVSQESSPFAPDEAEANADNVPITFSAKNISAKEALKIVTEVAKLRYRVDDDGTIMVTPVNAPDGEIVVRTYDVPSDIVDRFSVMTVTNGNTGEHHSDWKGFFADLGVQWPEGSKLKYVPTAGKLVVANTSDNLQQFEEVLNTAVTNAMPPPSKLNEMLGAMWKSVRRITPERSSTWEEDKKTREHREQVLRKLENIKIPQIEFRQADIADVITFLNAAGIEFDQSSAGKKGVDIALNLGARKTTSGPEIVPITFSARHISALEALKIVTEVANLEYRIDGEGIQVTPRNVPEKMITREYSCPPDVGKLISQTSVAIKPLTDQSQEIARAKVFPEEWKALMAGEFGMPLPAGSSIQYLPEQNKIIVVNTIENTGIFEKILGMGEEPPKESEPEQPTAARFKASGVNPFVDTMQNAFSTFAIDCDTASYTLMRNYITKGYLPPAESVRTEEFVNFFDYSYAPPTHDTFAVYIDAAPSRFGHGLTMLKIGVKGRRLGREEQRRAVLTFLVDTSGSMNKPDRIGLVKKSLKMLVEKMNPQDMIAIMQFDSHARLVLELTPASDIKKILAALDALQCSGSTNFEEGMQKAYETAARNFLPGGENRVLIMSDGVANLGTMEAADILKGVETYRKQGIFCSVFGVGIGTYNDEMLQQLANKGDGSYTFIDSEEEARRVLVDDLSATLNTIAKDVKIQVEFNPATVKRYRQLGYESRQLKKEDFRNDTVDAGEVGSGQSVTALYELEAAAGAGVQRSVFSVQDSEVRSQRSEVRSQNLGEQSSFGTRHSALGIVRVRYKRTDNGKVEEIEQPIMADQIVKRFDDADSRFRLAACAAEFSEILRSSPFAEGNDFDGVANALRPVALDLGLDFRVQEFLRLVQSAKGMPRGE